MFLRFIGIIIIVMTQASSAHAARRDLSSEFSRAEPWPVERQRGSTHDPAMQQFATQRRMVEQLNTTELKHLTVTQDRVNEEKAREAREKSQPFTYATPHGN